MIGVFEYLIYGLVDPRSMLVCYVGLSSRGLRRARQHSKGSKKTSEACRAWLSELHAAGVRHHIVILSLSARESVKSDERWWIAFGHACEWPLLNRTAGGDGCLNPCPETRAKLSAASKAYAAQPEVRARLSAQTSRQMKNPEQRELRRLGRIGKPWPRSSGPKEKRAGADRARVPMPGPRVYGPKKAKVPLSPEALASISEKARVRQSSPEARAAIGARTRAALASPEARAALSARSRAAMTPEARAAISKKATERQADPEVKRRISERVRAYRNRIRDAV